MVDQRVPSYTWFHLPFGAWRLRATHQRRGAPLRLHVRLHRSLSDICGDMNRFISTVTCYHTYHACLLQHAFWTGGLGI